jgi:hypothetical protein
MSTNVDLTAGWCTLCGTCRELPPKSLFAHTDCIVTRAANDATVGESQRPLASGSARAPSVPGFRSSSLHNHLETNRVSKRPAGSAYGYLVSPDGRTAVSTPTRAASTPPAASSTPAATAWKEHQQSERRDP